MKNIRFGIMGAGNVAHKFCEAIELVEGAEVVAVASKTPGKAAAFCNTHQLASFFESYEEMLENAEIDVVYIATTHNFHYENAMLCIQYKKAILCEKCFVLTEAEAKSVFEAAKEARVFVMEAMWSRFLPAVQKAKEWIESGVIGEVQLAQSIIGFKASEDPKGRILNPDLAGGAMYDIGVYVVELITYLINQDLKEIQAMVSLAHTGVDKVDNINLRFENCLANIQAVVSAYCPVETKIYGSEGYIVIPNTHYASECIRYRGYEKEEHFISPLQNGFEYQIQETISCIRQGKLESALMPHQDTIQCAAIFDQCLGTK
ncbi:MAG: Gfo/Idh/MocA family protein [Cellulosilyticaceae bacterium]